MDRGVRIQIVVDPPRKLAGALDVVADARHDEVGDSRVDFVLCFTSSRVWKIGSASGIPITRLTKPVSPLPLKSTVRQSRNSPIAPTDSGVSYPLETKMLKIPFWRAILPTSRGYSMKIEGSLYV